MVLSEAISALVTAVFIVVLSFDAASTQTTANVDFRHLLSESIKLESSESVHYRRIVDSLIKFVKFHKICGIETDFSTHQVIELVLIFQRVIKLKIALLKSLRRHAVIRDEKVHTQKDELQTSSGQIKVYLNQIACLKEFSSCINLEVIAKRLSSSKLEVIVDAIEYLLPYVKIFSTELDVCMNGSLLISHHLEN